MITTEELGEYLGVGEEKQGEVERIRAGALGRLRRATGVDWEHRPDSLAAEEALRAMVYLSYYGVRDGVKNTQFLEDYLTARVCELQFSKEAMGLGTGQEGGDSGPGEDTGAGDLPLDAGGKPVGAGGVPE